MTDLKAFHLQADATYAVSSISKYVTGGVFTFKKVTDKGYAFVNIDTEKRLFTRLIYPSTKRLTKDGKLVFILPTTLDITLLNTTFQKSDICKHCQCKEFTISLSTYHNPDIGDESIVVTTCTSCKRTHKIELS